jgi:hypothetical protein
MKITQIVTTLNKPCGLAYFAKNLHEQLFEVNVKADIISEMKSEADSDVLILHYHSELFDEKELVSFCINSKIPVVVFAHSEGADILKGIVQGFIGMCDGIFSESCQPNCIIPHPAWTPDTLSERIQLRELYNLPVNRTIIGSNGFLKFERQFDELLDKLLPIAKENDWLVFLLVSHWYLDSPGLIDKFRQYKTTYTKFFDFQYSYLDKKELNKKLQAFDLLWCWTKAPSSPYASGVISDQYASGTRIFATDKKQHEHVLKLPNVRCGSANLDLFIKQLISEIKSNNFQRHNPEIISWKRIITHLINFIKNVILEIKNAE